jgi:glycosyltransferase involved in cell wall biosynthesis
VRIMQLHNRYRQRGGEDVVVETEARLLRAAGHEVETYEVVNPEETAAVVRRLAVAPWNPRAAGRVRQVVTTSRPDVVHVHNTWFSLSPSVLAAARRAGVGVVLTLHNYRTFCPAGTLWSGGQVCTDCVGSHAWHAVRHRCYRGSAVMSGIGAATIELQRRRGGWERDVDRFLALTEFGRRIHVESGLPEDRVVLKSNSTDDPGPRSRPPSASRQVVYVGRLAPEKGVATLVDAWRHAPRGLELVIVGDGPERQALQARAPEGVTFATGKDDAWVDELLRGARALVFPSIWYEGQGLVGLEGAAAGLPVLHSRLGAVGGLFAPGSEPLTFTAGDTADLARALAQLEDDAFVDRWGARCRALYEERYTHEVAVRTLERVYEDVRR